MSDHRFQIIHTTSCSGCGSDLRKPDSVVVLFIMDSMSDQQSDASFDRLSQVDETGLLVDVGNLIKSGFHAGSTCVACNEQLEELVEDKLSPKSGIKATVYHTEEEFFFYVQLQSDVETSMGYMGYGSSDYFLNRFSDRPQPTDRFSHETDDLLLELDQFRTSMEIMRTGEDDAVGKVFGRISAELIRLSKPVLPSDTAALVTELLNAALGQSLSQQFAAKSVSSRFISLARKAAGMLTSLSREKTVLISVEDRVLEVEAIDDGVHLVVTDYDTTDGRRTPESLTIVEDGEGHECTIVDYRGGLPIGTYRLKEGS